ncbi:tRNA (adenosine(37)-N6)-dimethylallyltransferase MiaA [soil metagenome]
MADIAGDSISERLSTHTPVIVVDSMQVYKEIPIITNQKRLRPAELTGVVSVSEEWTMARHRQACDDIINDVNGPFVLDAGTGMYLNTILLDITIAPRASPEVRQRAELATTRRENPRRAARELELEISGSESRGSIWDGGTRFDLEILYLRPSKDVLDSAIERRSVKICQEGQKEVENLVAQFPDEIPNRSARDSIGVKEFVEYEKGQLSLAEAQQRIMVRTRRLARRQTRWFDKLARTLKDRAVIHVLENPMTAEKSVQHYVHKL